MSQNYHSLVSEFKSRIESDLIVETPTDTEEFVGLPYPYVVPGKGEKAALYYWDTYFTNYGLIKMKLLEYARNNVENLFFLLRKFGYVPASNRKDMLSYSQLPMLPWMVRDIYRATGDKEWLRRHVADLVKEFNFWTTKPHTTPSGLYRYVADGEDARATEAESGWVRSPRFDDARNYNPVDLNAILYRNAMIIHDLQVEVDGKGDKKLLAKSDHIKKLADICWDAEQGFYFDNDWANKKLSRVKTLAGFTPLFVEMIDEEKAASLQKNLKSFLGPGGLASTDHDYGQEASPWNHPLVCAPYIYFIIKGLCDYDYMEDAADIGTCWLDMVVQVYEKTGNLWDWYNVKEKSHESANGLANHPVMGWTAGTYIALIDALGLA